MKRISFVIPCYRSELTLERVINEIEEAMKRLQEEYQYEIILVNDCSPDQTICVIKRLCDQKSYIKGINFAKNFGQHAEIGRAHV